MTCRSLNYFEHFLFYLLPVVVSNSTFASLVRIPIGITSSAVGLKFCVITAEIKIHHLSRKNSKKHEKKGCY